MMVGSWNPCVTWLGLNQVTLEFVGSVRLILNSGPSGTLTTLPEMNWVGRIYGDGSLDPGVYSP